MRNGVLATSARIHMLFLLDYVELAQENINSRVHITELEENGGVDQIGQD